MDRLGSLQTCTSATLAVVENLDLYFIEYDVFHKLRLSGGSVTILN